MKRNHLALLLLLLLFSQQVMAQDVRVVFSSTGGFYDESFCLTLSCPEGYHIRYSINGDTPTSVSACYVEPLFLDESLYSRSDIYTIPTTIPEMIYVPESVQHCITLRAAAFNDEGQQVGPVATQSYFIHALGCDTHGLAVMALATDSVSLFDYNTGILVPGVNFDPADDYWTGNYYQSGDAWERRINVEFYEPDDNSGINQQAGLRTHGGTGRRGIQKGLKLYARDEYGKKRFKHKFFDAIPNNSFKHLVLHPFCCQWFSTGIQDGLCNQMARELGLESMATRPIVLYINGEYWGIYYLNERPDARYLEDHFGNSDEDYNVIGDWYGLNENGDSTNFMQMMEWLENADLSEDAEYEHLCSLIDVDNFIDYYCLELFIANNDWPANNVRCWQLRDGKWRWMFYDGDDALLKMDFDVIGNATCEANLGWPTDARSTLMFRRLLENKGFKDRFLMRFNELLSSNFSYAVTKPFYDTAVDLVKDEVPQQAARFNKPKHLNEWNNLVVKIDHFLENRCDNMVMKLGDYFTVADTSFVVTSLYPNPTCGEVHFLLWSESATIKPLEVYDMMGRHIVQDRLVLQSGKNDIVFSYPLSSGLYMVRIGNQSNVLVVQ